MTIKEEISERLKFVEMEIDVCNPSANDPDDKDFNEGKRITLMSEQLFLVGLINKIEGLGNDIKTKLPGPTGEL